MSVVRGFFYASIFSDKAGVSDIEIHNKWSNKSRPEAFNHRFEKFWDFLFTYNVPCPTDR